MFFPGPEHLGVLAGPPYTASRISSDGPGTHDSCTSTQHLHHHQGPTGHPVTVGPGQIDFVSPPPPPFGSTKRPIASMHETSASPWTTLTRRRPRACVRRRLAPSQRACSGISAGGERLARGVGRGRLSERGFLRPERSDPALWYRWDGRFQAVKNLSWYDLLLRSRHVKAMAWLKRTVLFMSQRFQVPSRFGCL